MIRLRALEPEDLDLLFSIENRSSYWEVSNTLKPFSRDILRKYIQNSHLDIFEAKQLRLVITNKTDNLVLGLVDLFNYDPQHQRAGIGILILKGHQNKGVGTEALKVFMNYAFTHLCLHQLYANIPSDNTKSIQLFEKSNFTKIGTQKDWIKSNSVYKDVDLYQSINPNHL